MRWLKHLSDSHTDEKLAMLRAEAGFEGYGFFWLALEIIAKQVDGSDGKTSVTYPIKFWCQLAGTLPSRFQRLANSCATLGLLSVKVDGNMLTIGCDNILKYRDEWSRKKTKNSGVTPESLRSKDTETEADTEKEKDTLILKSSQPDKGTAISKAPPQSPPSPDGSGLCVGEDQPPVGSPEKPKRKKKAAKAPAEYSASFLEFWAVYPRKEAKPVAYESWQSIGKRGDVKAARIIEAIKAQVASGHLGADIQHIPHPSTWLNQARWEDEIAPPGLSPVARARPDPRPRTFYQQKQAENEEKARLVLKILEAENGQAATDSGATHQGGRALPVGQVGT